MSPAVSSAESERAALLAALAGQRHHILGIVDGLEDKAFDRATLPSGWTIRGLLSHLAHDDERFWFRGVLAAEPEVTEAVLAGEPNAWTLLGDLTPAQVLDVYRTEIDRSAPILADVDLDAPPTWWPPKLFGDWRLTSNRAVILHMITETACHAGHLDAARELIDGRQWIVLDA